MIAHSRAVVRSVLAVAAITSAIFAVEPRLLVADLDGDGLALTDRFFPVEIDLDGDLESETLSWTAQGHEDGFLWIDLNGDGRVAGNELVGSEMRWEGGSRGSPFEVLASFDREGLGGDGDGSLTPRDRVWDRLRVWIDSDHDGKAGRCEISRLSKWGIFEIELEPRGMKWLDGGLNLHVRWSVMRTSPSGKRGRSRRNAGFLRLTEVLFDLVQSSNGEKASSSQRQRPVRPANRRR